MPYDATKETMRQYNNEDTYAQVLIKIYEDKYSDLGPNHKDTIAAYLTIKAYFDKTKNLRAADPNNPFRNNSNSKR